MTVARMTAALLLAAGAAAAVGAAESPKIAIRPVAEPPAPVMRVSDGALRLTLDEAIAVSLGHNLGLMVERYSRESFRLGIERELAIYDFGISADLRITDSESPAASNLDGAEVSTRESVFLGAGVRQLFPWGGVLTGSLDNTRAETNSSFSLLNPSFTVGLAGEYRQPLLRNFGRDATEHFIRLARIDSSVSQERLQLQASLTVQNVANAYWELVEARDQVEVAEESLALARQLHDINRVRVDVGTLAPLELVQSEAGIATREETIIRARARVGDAEDSLRRLLGLSESTLWDAPIVPETTPAAERFEIDVDQAWRTALEKRPEVHDRQLQQEKRELEAAYRAAQTKPQLDLVVGYGLNGIGGDSAIQCDDFAVTSGLCTEDQIGQVISERKGGWDDAASQIADRDFDDWSIGLSFSMPLQNTAAKTNATLARLEVERGRVEIRDTEHLVLTEVRRAARAVRTAEQQIDSARVSRQLAERNLEAEQKRYDNGLSTSFQVLEIQEDLSQARSREIAAVATYERAVAEYRRVTGELLESWGVEWAEG